MPRFAYFEGTFSKFPEKGSGALRPPKRLAALSLKFSAIFSLGSC